MAGLSPVVALEYINLFESPQIKMEIAPLLHLISKFFGLSLRWVRALYPLSSSGRRQGHAWHCSQPWARGISNYDYTTTIYNTLLTLLPVSSDTAIAIAFGVLGTAINIFGIIIAYLTLRAINTENRTSYHPYCPKNISFDMRNEDLKRSDKLVIAEAPRPQPCHIHEHTHTFGRRDTENNVVRRVGNINKRVLKSF